MSDMPMESILVTCCIPSYNHENYIKEAIDSVIKQSYDNIELIIIDDGSTDTSVNKIKELKMLCQERFANTIFIFRENHGLSRTLNEMLELANGEFITFLASDDKFSPEKIGYLVNEMGKLNDTLYCAAFGDAEIFSELDDKLQGSFIEKYTNGKIPVGDVTYENILNKNFLPAMSGLYARNKLLEIGGFTNDLRLEDWDLYLRLLQKYKIRLFSKTVAHYRLHGANSIYVENVRLLKDTLCVLLSQQQYAFSHGYNKIWHWKLYDTYYALRRKKSLSYNEVRFFSTKMAASYMLNKLRKKFFRPE